MSKKRIASHLVLFLMIFPVLLFAQEDDLGTEVVNIVKPYTPTISDAFKVKETPVLNDSVTTQKKEVIYTIFSVPVASTFTPAKGKATTVEKAKPIKLFDNYATLGFGNYTSILGELYSNFELSRTDNAGFFFRHNSSQGDIDGVRLENKYYDTSLDGNYTSRQRDASYNLEAGIQHQLFNWYGLPESFDTAPNEFIAAFDPQQTYFSGYVGGNISLDESMFEGLSAKVRYLGDAYSSSEFNIRAQPEFEFPLTDFTLTIDGDVDYLSGSFERNYFAEIPINYSFLNAGIAPSLVYVDTDLTLSLGVAAYASLDTENSDTNFSIAPRINVSYRLVDELLIAYGGAEGGLEQNSYFSFKEQNPFVSPTLQVMPTQQLYNAFGGLKGKLSNSVGYNLRASYGKENDKALFVMNPLNDIAPTEAYQYGNSFQVVYDDVNTLSIFGELKVEMSDVFTLGISGEYLSYTTTNETQPWNLPDLKATVFSNFNITEEIYGGASLFYVGERMDRIIAFSPLVDPFPTEVTLDGYLDANVHLGYRVNERLSIFVKGSNLLSDNYEKWYNYPVQGIQGLLGATYKFDW
ncbi:TonB-dependent receptor [Altibacter sp.]|uniref:TonB-dependent receptor n=1 Tax=Altibacter sp. TaxID=2024823 RepID=UPI00258DA60C|nr:TonB-dependent receptor [Altibacter sp.]MCW9037501.1 TonB-dependent receptor [Altibacter sp.]